MSYRLSLPLAVFALLMAVRSSPAQNGPWEPLFEKQFQSQIDHKLLILADAALDLSDEQVAALAHMRVDHQRRFSEFQARWEPVSRAFDARMQALVASPVPRFEVQLEREASLAEAADEQAALDARFLEGIRVLLAPAQEARFPGFIRAFNRERWLRDMGYPEQSIDLVALVNQVVDLDAMDLPEGVAEVLAEYETKLDSSLSELVAARIAVARKWIRRELYRYQTSGDTLSLGRMTPEDQRRFRQEREREGELLRAMRDLNRAYKTILQSLLPPDAAQAFEAAYFELAMRPALGYNPLPLAKYADQVLANDQLTPEQREAIEAMMTAHREKARRLEKRVIAAADSAVSAEYDETSSSEKQRRRNALDVAVRDRIAADEEMLRYTFSLLTPAQQERLPLPSPK